MTTTTQTAPQTAESCLCREVLRRLDEVFGLKSDAARQHLRNSRVEFLKAIRSLIDARIDHLSQTGEPGTKLTVE